MGEDQCQAGRILPGRPCPLAPIHEPNTGDPAQDWALLFRPGDLTSAAEGEWGFELGQYDCLEKLCDPSPGLQGFPWMPDGKVPVIPNLDGPPDWIMFWPGGVSCRTLSDSAFPEDHHGLQLDPEGHVCEPETKEAGGWDCGGRWLMDVFRLSKHHMLGFFHAENRWDLADGVVWKSTGLMESWDQGRSWSTGGPIITAGDPRPAEPQFGGTADQCTLWDPFQARWITLYTTPCGLHLAQSRDLSAAPGTWQKWVDGEGFCEPGLGGRDVSLSPLNQAPGGNPAVHWNVLLQRWVVVWCGWDKQLWLSTSLNLEAWEPPRLLLVGNYGFHTGYPTILCHQGDAVAGGEARLYYGDHPSAEGTREFAFRPISFHRTDGQLLPGDCRGHGPKRLGFCQDQHAQPAQQECPVEEQPEACSPWQAHGVGGVSAQLERVLHIPGEKHHGHGHGFQPTEAAPVV